MQFTPRKNLHNLHVKSFENKFQRDWSLTFMQKCNEHMFKIIGCNMLLKLANGQVMIICTKFHIGFPTQVDCACMQLRALPRK